MDSVCSEAVEEDECVAMFEFKQQQEQFMTSRIISLTLMPYRELKNYYSSDSHMYKSKTLYKVEERDNKGLNLPTTSKPKALFLF